MSDQRTGAAPAAPRPDIGPPALKVTMGNGHVVAIRAPLYSLTRHENMRGESFGVLTLAYTNGMALYFEHDAASLRELAAACLVGADRLDGGAGKQ